jgi:hypothetical protein
MEERRELADPDYLRVALEVAEDLLAERVGDLGVNPGVLDVAVPEMVGHVLNAAAGVEEVDGDRVAKRVDRAPRDPRCLGVVLEQVLNLAFFKGPSRPVKR